MRPRVFEMQLELISWLVKSADQNSLLRLAVKLPMGEPSEEESGLGETEADAETEDEAPPID